MGDSILYFIYIYFFGLFYFFYRILQKRNCIIEQQDLLYITEICNLFSLVQIFVILDQMQIFFVTCKTTNIDHPKLC